MRQERRGEAQSSVPRGWGGGDNGDFNSQLFSPTVQAWFPPCRGFPSPSPLSKCRLCCVCYLFSPQPGGCRERCLFAPPPAPDASFPSLIAIVCARSARRCYVNLESHANAAIGGSRRRRIGFAPAPLRSIGPGMCQGWARGLRRHRDGKPSTEPALPLAAPGGGGEAPRRLRGWGGSCAQGAVPAERGGITAHGFAAVSVGAAVLPPLGASPPHPCPRPGAEPA